MYHLEALDRPGGTLSLRPLQTLVAHSVFLGYTAPTAST
jgi:hypothetical protein